VNDRDKVRIVRVNRLGRKHWNGSLTEDAQGDESPSDEERAADKPIAQPTVVKTNMRASVHSKISASPPVKPMRCPGRAKKHLSQKPGGNLLIWRIAPSPTERTPKPSSCWKNIWS